jgi:hypothetical protein
MLDLLLIEWLPNIVTQLRFIHNWVTTGIQWMVHWWVLLHCDPERAPLSAPWPGEGVGLYLASCAAHSSSWVAFHQVNLLCFICSDKPIFEHNVHGTSFQLLVCILHQLDGLTSLCFVLFCLVEQAFLSIN